MKKILVVEDNHIIRENIIEILYAFGYDPIIAENGVEGLSKASTNLIDLVISDIMMPEMDGYEFFRRFNEIYSDYHIPFIFLTSKTDENEIKKGMNLGVDHYLTKPFKVNDLIGTIEASFSKKWETSEI